MAKLELGVDVTVAGTSELDKIADSIEGVSTDLDTAAESLQEADRHGQNLNATMDGLGDGVRGVTDLFKGLGDVASGDFTGIADIASGLGDSVSGVLNGVLPAFDAIKDGALTSAVEMGKSVGTQIAAWATLGVQSLLHAAKVALAWVIALGPIGLLVAAVVAAVALIILNWDKVSKFLGEVFANIGKALAAVGAFIRKTWDGILAFFGGIVKGIADFGKVLWTPISKGFEAAIGVIKGIWNGFVRFWNSIQISIPSLDIPFIGKIGGFTIGLPDLPMLAQGGIVTQPTLAILGEKGPEAVVPLGRGGMAGTNVTVNIYGDVQGSERRIPGQMLRALYVAGLD